ncbi:hypothetical protein [Christiangramia sabulilitoris]|uniref:DUF4369 domain-containing protein n=1 Tax=Christiangramia sabulilitoris TaxID=2583991 RepID=A0A550I0P8_9FLAO|nr:hypothetical protein [Christiangramia sabulilitoris]TRO64525.1 hypothetical protein FGM01_13640 [Christiangramia sabulilitoris]
MKTNRTGTVILFLIMAMIFSFSARAQYGNPYHEARLELRNGEILTGEAKIQSDGKVKFKDEDRKQAFNYRNLKNLQVYHEKDTINFTYKIIAGKEPRLLRIIKEYDQRINLYAIYIRNNQYYHIGESTPVNPNMMMVNSNGVMTFGGGSLNANEYYVNKGSGHEVIKLGYDIPIKKGKFRRVVNEFFQDCPEIIEQLEDSDYKYRDIPDLVEYYKDNCASL